MGFKTIKYGKKPSENLYSTRRPIKNVHVWMWTYTKQMVSSVADTYNKIKPNPFQYCSLRCKIERKAWMTFSIEHYNQSFPHDLFHNEPQWTV